jgi:trans-aconitate methyltransferase
VTGADRGERPPEEWAGYYRWIEGREPRPLLRRALSEYGAVSPGAVAVDLGCGDGVETRALLAAGFRVTAVDSADASMDRLGRLPEAGSTLTLRHLAMEETELPPADLVYAGYALPFCPPEAFAGLWRRILAALRPGGVLACDLFGQRDTWAGESGMTFLTRARVAALLEEMDLVHLEEVEEDGNSFSGPKHWHTYQVVARAR